MIESPALDEVKELIRQRAKAEAWAEAELATRQKDILDNLELRFGHVPPPVSAKLAEVKDATRLRELHRLSVTCPTLEAFAVQIEVLDSRGDA